MVNQDRYKISIFIKEMGVSAEDISLLFQQYFEEMNEELITIRKLLADKEWFMLQRVVHNVKGVSANLGIYDVHEKAVQMDSQLKNAVTENLDMQLRELEKLIADAHVEIQSYFRGLNLSIL